MADQTLSVKIIGDSSSLAKAVDQAKSKVESFASDEDGAITAAGETGNKIGSSLVGKIKSVITVAAIGKTLVDSIKEGARYEQAVGGIETLFKDSSDRMIKYANEAWKTAGISANDYMEQTTSVAAALLQSLGGDSKKAAEAANQAVIDMADNANKMGTSLDSIQNAYQGFAKQNYTMLDNLKLGYGGTKTEMERLLADAEKLSGQKYDISNLSDVYEAIHIIQTELGITGTTAAEAEKTISGSFNAMKSAFSNFMAQLTTGGDVSAALTNVADSAVTFVIGNLVPALGKIVAAIPSVLIGLLGEALPKVFDGLSSLMDNLLSDKGMEAADKFGTSFGEKILPALGKLVPSMLEFLVKFAVAIPSYAMRAATSFVETLGTKIINGIKSVVEKIKKAFKFNITLPKIKLPHFSISPSGWKLGDLLKGSIPKLSIAWKAKGDILSRPTALPVAGEAGPEALIPLTDRIKMRPFADMIAERMDRNSSGGDTYNFGNITVDVSKLEDVATVNQFVNMMKQAKAFA